MTPEDLSKRLYALEKKIRTKGISYSATALTGDVKCCQVLGVNYTTGDIFYRDGSGEWQLAVAGGGGGSGVNIYSSDGQLATDRVLDLNDHLLTFQNNSDSFFDIDPTSGLTNLAAKTGATTTGINLDSNADIASLSGSIKFPKYGTGTITGTSTYFLSVDADGNVLESPLGSGNTIYTGDASLSGNRIVNLDGKILQLSDATSTTQVTIDPTVNTESVAIQAANITGAGNTGQVSLSTTDTEGRFGIVGAFNNTDKIAIIQGISNTTESSILISADRVDIFNALSLGGYGSGNHTGTPVQLLAVDGDGNVIETSLTGSGDTLQDITDNGNSTNHNIIVQSIGTDDILVSAKTSTNSGASIGVESEEGYLSLTDGTGSGTLKANNLTDGRNYQLPDANGTLVLSVNNVTATDNGNVSLEIGIVSKTTLTSDGTNSVTYTLQAGYLLTKIIVIPASDTQPYASYVDGTPGDIVAQDTDNDVTTNGVVWDVDQLRLLTDRDILISEVPDGSNIIFLKTQIINP